MNHYHEWRVCWQINRISFGGLAPSSIVNNIPKIHEKYVKKVHFALETQTLKNLQQFIEFLKKLWFCNVNPLKTFLYSPRMMNSCGLNFWQKHCYVNSYYGKIGVEKFERELESTLIYNHIDAKIRINSLTPPLLLLLSKRSLLLPAATAYCSITYQKNLH